MFQTKEKDKNPQNYLSEEEIGNLPEKEFKVVIVRMIQDLRKKKKMGAQIEKLQEVFNKEVEDLKIKQTKMNNTISEMKKKNTRKKSTAE